MKKMFIILCMLGFMPVLQAQDYYFSQFYDLPMLRNPALAGIFTGEVRVSASFRNQWQSVTVPYKTVGLGLEFKRATRSEGDDYFTLGLQATHDAAGDIQLSRTQIFPVINYHKSLGGDQNSYLSAAFMAGPVMQQFDPSKLRFDDQFQNGSYSASNPTGQRFDQTRLTYWDPAAGICYSQGLGRQGANIYVGIGVSHFTRPRVAFQPGQDVRMNTKFALNAGLAAPSGAATTWILYADYFKQGGSQLIQGGAMLNYALNAYENSTVATFSAGLFYRLQQALIPVVKMQYGATSIGLSYDVNMNGMAAASQHRGGFELTISYTGSRYRNKASEQVRCPRFY